MAKQPHHDDDSAKKPNGAPKTPKPAIPNMSLDEPEEALEVEEVIEDDVPIAKAAPVEEEAIVLTDEDLLEEVVEAEPAGPV